MELQKGDLVEVGGMDERGNVRVEFIGIFEGVLFDNLLKILDPTLGESFFYSQGSVRRLDVQAG